MQSVSEVPVYEKRMIPLFAFITLAVVGWQFLIILGSVFAAVFWGKKGAIIATIFWTAWTVLMVFYPPLMCTQLVFTAIAGVVAFPIGLLRDRMRESKRLSGRHSALDSVGVSATEVTPAKDTEYLADPDRPRE